MVSQPSATASAMPNPGTYYIVNRVLSPAGQKLALTFKGERNTGTVTVTPLTKTSNQAWCIRNFYDGHTQSVSPASKSHLEIGMGPGIIRVLPPGNYVWTLRNTPSGLTIQDGGVTVFWGLSDANVEQNVAFGDEDERANQRWILIPV
ncbi:CCL2-like lectin domain-containing protein [Pleurotus pulmonarius]